MNNVLSINEISRSTVCRVDARDIIDLRHEVLRQGLPKESATFPGDNDPETWHFATRYPNPPIYTADVVCCASFMKGLYLRVPAWQLRGMATRSDLRGIGFGKVLLNVAERTLAQETETRMFWCNARISAVSFYEKNGWQQIGSIFEIATAGPHVVMWKNYVGR